MQFSRGKQATSLADQPVSRLADLLVTHRSALEARATRILKDPFEAADVVQEAFFKFMVAAPDLDSDAQALAYLRTTVTNLSISLLRKKQVRPTLTAIDDDTAQAEIDRASAFTVDNDQALINAEDAAIVRMALSKLSPAQRQALVMREVSGMDIDQIAKEFGVKPGNARVIVHRAREAFRHALETTIVDEKRGLTAADMLSVSIQKATKVAKDAGKVAMALLLVISGIGFFLNGRNTTQEPLAIEKPSQSSPQAKPSAATPTPEATSATTAVTPTDSPQPQTVATVDPEDVVVDSKIESALASLSKSQSAIAQMSQAVTWPGADSNGIPSGAWVGDGFTTSNALVVNSDTKFNLDGSIYTTSDLITMVGKNELILNQSINYKLNDLQYSLSPTIKVGNQWIDLKVLDKSVEVTKFNNIQVLITAWLVIETAETNLKNMPSVIGVRIHTTEVGQPIFGQSVVLITNGVAQ